MTAEHSDQPTDSSDDVPTTTAQRRHDDDVPTGAVVAGLDGSDKDRAVLAFATREALLLHSSLHLLTAQEVHAGLVSAWDAGFVPIGLEPELGANGARVLDEARAVVRSDSPDLPVTASQPWGTPSQALVDASAQARIVVVGSGRKGNLERILLGTTSLDTAMHAACPVVVVGEDPGDLEGQVVVGVDGSEHSLRAAVVAGDEAARRRTGLVVVTTWWLEVVDGIVVTEEGTPQWERVEARYRAMLDQALAPVRERHPELLIDIDLRNARPVDVLLERSQDAGLVVVGSRGRGGFAGMALGSVSHKVLQRSLVPVGIVRAEARTDQGD